MITAAAGAGIGRVLVAVSILVLVVNSGMCPSSKSSLSNFCHKTPDPAPAVSTISDKKGGDHPTEIDGLILARRGSKGIPHKNVALINGHPLIHYALEAMIESKVFSRIWISTDCPLVLEYIENATHKMPIRIHNRASFTATDEATSLIAVQEFLKHHTEIKVVGLVQATSPLIQPQFLNAAAELMRTAKADSVFAVTRQHKFRWSEGGRWSEPLNFDPRSRPRRQDWPGELIENGMFYFMIAKIVNEGLLQGERSLHYEIPKEFSLEIDNPDDLEYAEILLKKTERKDLLKCSHQCE